MEEPGGTRKNQEDPGPTGKTQGDPGGLRMKTQELLELLVGAKVPL